MARKEAGQPDDATLAQMEQEDHAQNDFAVVQAGSNLALGQVAGEDNDADIRLPRLQIAYGVGKLSANFNPGDLVLGGDNLLVKRDEPLNMIILSTVKYWKEYLTNDRYQAGERPKTFLTAKEVHDAGGTTEWCQGVGPSYNNAMDLRLFIEKPEDLVCGLFGINILDKQYAPAIYSVDKSAYRRVGPFILTTNKFALRERGLHTGVFELKTTQETINNNPTFVPNIRLAGHLSDEAVVELEQLFNVAGEQPSADG